MTFEQALRAIFGELGLDASTGQIEILNEHFRLLERWNRSVNLTSVIAPLEAARRHYGESAFLHREMPATRTLVDVGSGAGFPGLPIAVLRPATRVALVESNRKKAAFLKEATRDLPNVEVFDCRVADWGGTAEWAALRAVAPGPVLDALDGRVARAAVLGTDAPAEGAFGAWERRPIPWADRAGLWLGTARDPNSKQCST